MSLGSGAEKLLQYGVIAGIDEIGFKIISDEVEKGLDVRIADFLGLLFPALGQIVQKFLDVRGADSIHFKTAKRTNKFGNGTSVYLHRAPFGIGLVVIDPNPGCFCNLNGYLLSVKVNGTYRVM